MTLELIAENQLLREKVEKYEKAIDDIEAEINRKIQEENYGVTSDHTHEDGLEEALEIIDKHIEGKETEGVISEKKSA